MENEDRKPYVLIVDDETNVAETLKLIFNSSGYHARAANSAEQALEMMTGWHPNLAVVDVFLPGMNGVDLASRIQADIPRCRVMLLSAQPQAIEVAAGVQNLFELHPKPIHPTEMLGIAARLLQTEASAPERYLEPGNP